MAARARKTGEPFEQYRRNLRIEQRATDALLAGHSVYNPLKENINTGRWEMVPARRNVVDGRKVEGYQ